MRRSATGMFALAALLLAAPSGHAQAPPPPPSALPPAPQVGFVPPFEIMRTVRAAGFKPVAPPLREGTTYVLRAMDFRGILMRVVVDAHTGAIRAVNRIVPSPGSDNRVGMVSPPYGPADDMLPSYGEPPDLRNWEPPADETGSLPPMLPMAPGTPATHPAARATVTVLPPLPRARPAAIASRKPIEDARPEIAPSVTPAAKPGGRSDTRLEAKPDVKSGATTAAPAPQPATATAAPAAPAVASTPPPAKPSKLPPGPPIND